MGAQGKPVGEQYRLRDRRKVCRGLQGLRWLTGVKHVQELTRGNLTQEISETTSLSYVPVLFENSARSLSSVSRISFKSPLPILPLKALARKG